MRFPLSLFALLVVFQGNAAQYQKPYGQLKAEQKFKDYTVRIYRDELGTAEKAPSMACFEILLSGKQIYFQTGNEFEIGNSGNGDITNRLIEIGHSITSDKTPNLVIKDWSGGAHCCYRFFIFQIGATFKFIDSIDLQDGVDSDFKDLRRDGNLELVIQDWTFRYWNAGFSDSFAPEVILRYWSGKYRPDLELMKKPAPTQQELEKMVGEIKPLFGSKEMRDDLNNKLQVPPLLWGRMLELIYTGNMSAAWRLCDLSWPANHPGKSIFLKEFTKQLQTSQYYKEINQASFQGMANQKS